LEGAVETLWVYTPQGWVWRNHCSCCL